MADKDSGDKTEKPTPHALKEARKRGEIAKSRDVGLTLGFVFALLMLWLSFGFVTERIAMIMHLALEAPGQPFLHALKLIGHEALMTFLLITAALIVPIAAFGLLVEFLQTGPVMTVEKMLPKMEYLNPIQGLKRMFSMDNLMELLKSIIQTALLVVIAGWVLLHALDDIADLPFATPGHIVEAAAYLIVRVFGWTCLAFILMMFVDAAWQRHSFTKKMKMSQRDIKQENKNLEGDPQIRSTRRQLAQEWSREGATRAAREASVLVVNPTHVAIALQYLPEQQKVPSITARAENELALMMRQAAEQAGTPILRNEQLARTLLNSDAEADAVPRALFDIVAEVILWAQSVRQRLDRQQLAAMHGSDSTASTGGQNTERRPPGEDLTHYPPMPLLPTPP